MLIHGWVCGLVFGGADRSADGDADKCVSVGFGWVCGLVCGCAGRCADVGADVGVDGVPMGCGCGCG